MSLVQRVMFGTVLCGLALCGLASGAMAQAPSPACSTAPTITGVPLSLTGNNNAGVLDDSTSCTFLDDAAVWYRYLPPTTGTYTLSTAGSDFDTTLSLWASCTATAPFACNDDDPTSAAVTSLLSGAALTQNVAVFVRIAGYFGDQGDFVLSITGPSTSTDVVCCRGATCAIVPAAACVPQGPAGALAVPTASACNGAGNDRSPCCHADFNKAGGLSVDDIFLFLNAWFSSSPLAKVGGDGTATPVLDDIFLFLGAWFAGCA